MPPVVVWSRRAEGQLGTALGRTVYPAGEPHTGPVAERAAISARLARAFLEFDEIVILNHFVGFRHRPGEHILQIDVRGATDARTYVVKLAGDKKLRRELAAWELLGLRDSNPVFMPLSARWNNESLHELSTLAYQDAGQHIGYPETVWLEETVRRCVRFSSPVLDSLVGCFVDIFAQLARLSANARLIPPSTKIETMPSREHPGIRHTIDSALERWTEPAPRRIRQRVNAAVAVGETRFIDPVDYFRMLNAELAAGTAPESQIPSVWRGLAHGDLHGRNSLVGIDERERANFPTIFDYDSVSPDNPIGWDYVELETELKIRADESIFGSDLETEARSAIDFECELTEATQECAARGCWDEFIERGDSPRLRLQSIMLAIRRDAMRVLDRQRSHAGEWLREYWHLLACYNLTSVRYTNQSESQRGMVFAAAGVACAELDRLRTERNSDRPATYQIPLALARRGNRSGTDAGRKQAEVLLAELAGAYPTAIHVRFEQAFNLVQQSRGPEALEFLPKLEIEFGERLDTDCYSLWGRCYKQPGDRHLQAGFSAPAESAEQRSAFRESLDAYERAAEYYRKAFAVNGDFFPGINLALLDFLRAGLCTRLGRRAEAAEHRQESLTQARILLAAAPIWQPRQPDDAIWMRATEADAALLTGDVPFAVERYRAALAQPGQQHHHPQTIGRQLHRILDGYWLLGEPIFAEALEEFKRNTNS